MSFYGVKCPWLFHFILFYFCWEEHEARKKGVPSPASLSLPRDLLTRQRWAKASGASVSGAEVSLVQRVGAEQRARENWPWLRSPGGGGGGLVGGAKHSAGGVFPGSF